MQGFVPDYMQKMRYLDRLPSSPTAISWSRCISSGLSCLFSLFVIILLLFRMLALFMSSVPKPTSMDYIVVFSGLAIVGGKFALSLMVFLYSLSNPAPAQNDILYTSIVVGINALILAFYVAALIVLGGQDPTGLTMNVLLLCVIVVSLELIVAIVALLASCFSWPTARPMMMMRPMPMYMPIQQQMP